MGNIITSVTPHSELTECVSLLHSATSFKEVKDVIKKVTDRLEMDKFIYGSQIPISYVRPITTIVDGYPDDWRDVYEGANYMALDPTIAHCQKSTIPILWSAIPREDQKINEFLGSAHDHGLRGGISVPIQGLGREWGMLSFSIDKDIEQSRSIELASLSLLYAPFIHEAVRRLVHEDNKREKGGDGSFKLTARETEVLVWTAEGKTAGEISIILSIAERTVVFHLQNVARKLDVANRTHAVAKAISLGLINPML